MISGRDWSQKWFPIPLPDSDTFKGHVVVVTGATSGLGLAAAVHFVNLGASQVIITGRSVSKAEVAKDKIEAAAGPKAHGKVQFMKLDMNRYSSIIAFVTDLKQVRAGKGGVDYVVLNAGLGAPEFRLSPEGLEEDLQVNAVSTTLLGLLLLAWMKEEHQNRDSPAHLGFVNSGQAAGADIERWTSWAGDGGVLTHLSKEENWGGNGDAYNSSKLISLYGIMEISKLAVGANGRFVHNTEMRPLQALTTLTAARPFLIVNPICPGIVKTDITRDLGATASVFMSVLGKSPENGSRSLVNAYLTTEGENVSDSYIYDGNSP